MFELTLSTVTVGSVNPFLEKYVTLGRTIRADRFGKLLGAWTAAFGPLNQVVTLHEYSDYETWGKSRRGLQADDRWLTEVAQPCSAMLESQERIVLNNADFYPVNVPTEASICDLRIYQIQHGKFAEYSEIARGSAPIRFKYSRPMGMWAAESGLAGRAVSIWPYRDFNHRVEVQKGTAADPGWQEAIRKATPLIKSQDVRMLTFCKL